MCLSEGITFPPEGKNESGSSQFDSTSKVCYIVDYTGYTCYYSSDYTDG